MRCLEKDGNLYCAWCSAVFKQYSVTEVPDIKEFLGNPNNLHVYMADRLTFSRHFDSRLYGGSVADAMSMRNNQVNDEVGKL